MIFKTYRRSKTYTEKLRIKYALLGIALFVIPAVLTNAILPLWFNIYSLNALVPLFSILLVSFISYAIIKHEFLDIKVIIQRGVIYTALLSVVTATYVGLIFLGEVLLQGSEAVNATLSAFITTLLGIFGVPRLKLYFEKITDPIFFKHRYDYATVLGELTDVLNKTIVLDTIIEKTQYILGQALKMSSLQFYLHGGEKPSLQEHELLFPVMSSKKKVGYIVLGEKRSGDPYTIEDKKLLETFAKQAGIALEKAALYKQVKDYATTLEQKVEERTQEIKNIQRDQESLMLEISHGLQTPLTVMKGELFFLRKQGADQEKIEVLDTSIDRISAFIYRLLNISQLESSLGKEQRELSLSSTLTSLLGFFQEEALRKNIILSGKIDNNITILGNEDEITELFSNLISNSIKYIGQKSEKTIAVEATIHDTVTVVTIKDSGIGMEALEVKKLFQKFSRIKNEYTKNIPGTGLGLAICKKIVEIHKGTIAVTSNLGEGTSIAISLPLYKK
jgi:signal transduction histidine kinase